MFLWAVVAIGVWVGTTQYGFKTNGAEGRESTLPWASDSSLLLAGDRPTLLLFIHPRCPCTRATIRELQRTLRDPRIAGSHEPKVIVVASSPADEANEWSATETVRRASALPRAEFYQDIGGKEASRFGAVTSGDVRLFQQDGELLFAGGVTASRGHEGDSVGNVRLYQLLSQPAQSPQPSTPVFGCQLCIEPGAPVCDETCLATVSGHDQSVEGVAP